MKNNKLVSIVLALLVCLSLVVSASAATESDLTFALESSDSNVELLDAAVVDSGETFTVTVNIAKNPGFLAAIASVKYDAAVLEFVPAEEATEGVNVSAPIEGLVNITLGNPSKAVTSPDKAEKIEVTGAVVTLTFKVLATEDQTASIEISASNKNVIIAKNTTAENVNGDELALNVVGEDHDCGKYETVEAGNAAKATCTEAGKATDLLCKHCGETVTKGEEIAALGHDFSGEGVITTEPGCETMGVRTYTCANGCGETQVDDKVPAIGHAFGDWTVSKAATVEAEGEETRTCANCNGTEKRSIAKLPAPATQPTQPTQPTEPAAKGVSPWVIVAIVVVVLAGAGVAAFFVLKNKKK